MTLSNMVRIYSRISLIALTIQTAANAASLPDNIPFKQAAPEDDTLIYRAIAAFLFACAAAYAIAWLIKRYAPGIRAFKGTDQRLQRLEAIRITQRTTLLRIRWGDEELLIGENEHSITLLGKQPLTKDAANGALRVAPDPELQLPDARNPVND